MYRLRMRKYQICSMYVIGLEAQAARRGDPPAAAAPRARGAERRRVCSRAAAQEGLTGPKEQVLQGISAEGQTELDGAGVLS
jgi:hypothetical protein